MSSPLTRMLVSVAGGGLHGLASLDVLNPHLLLDERGLTTVTGYSAWANQGLAGGSFAQATTTKQPATGSSINGHAAPDFDGTDDVLTSSFAASAVSTATEFEGHVVVLVDALPANPTFSSFYGNPGIISGGSPAPFTLLASLSGAQLGTDGTSVSYGVTPYAQLFADARAYLISFRLEGTQAYVRIDRGKWHSWTFGTPIAGALTNPMNLGSNYAISAFLNGRIANLMMRKTVLTPTERAGRDALISTKYGTSAVVPKEFLLCGHSMVAQAGDVSQWRGNAQTRMDARPDGGKWYVATGPLAPAFTPFSRDRCMAGGGLTIAGLRSNFAAATQNVGTIFNPDVIVIQCTANDSGISGHDNTTIINDLGACIDDAHTRCPSARIGLWMDPKRSDSTPLHDQNIALEPLMAALAANRLGAGVDIVYSNALWQGTWASSDGLHQNSSETAAMGAIAYADLCALGGQAP